MKVSKNNLIATLKHYFETYKDSNTCFVTNDGTVFHKAEDADAHVDSLTDRTISEYDREYVMNLKQEKAEEKPAETPEEKPAPQTVKNPDPEEEKKPAPKKTQPAKTTTKK